MPRACALTTVATSESVLDRERFKSLWARSRTDHRCGEAEAVFDELVRRYANASRHYHTPEHVAHCLRQFDAASPHMDEPDAVELALWFHDVIYDIHADDNELRSAQLFDRLAGASMPPELKKLVHELIMVTTHDGLPRTASVFIRGDTSPRTGLRLDYLGGPVENQITEGYIRFDWVNGSVSNVVVGNEAADGGVEDIGPDEICDAIGG